MSNKPCKHSELKKKGSTAKRMRASWGKPRSAVPTIRIRPERFLIVTEGTKTEPYYFEGFRRRINAEFHGEYVTLRVCGVGDNTISLFERARSIASADPDGFTQVWVVYDRDSFPSRDFNAVVDLCSAESGRASCIARRGRTSHSSCGIFCTSPTSTRRWIGARTFPCLRAVFAPMVLASTRRTARTCSASLRTACGRRSRTRRGSKNRMWVVLPPTRTRARQFICSSRSLCPIWVLKSRVKGVE